MAVFRGYSFFYGWSDPWCCVDWFKQKSRPSLSFHEGIEIVLVSQHHQNPEIIGYTVLAARSKHLIMLAWWEKGTRPGIIRTWLPKCSPCLRCSHPSSMWNAPEPIVKAQLEHAIRQQHVAKGFEKPPLTSLYAPNCTSVMRSQNSLCSRGWMETWA